MIARSVLRIAAPSVLALAMSVGCGDDPKTTTDTTTPDSTTATDTSVTPDAGDTSVTPDVEDDTSVTPDVEDDTSVAPDVEDDTSVTPDVEDDTVTPPATRVVFGDDYGTDITFMPFGGSTNAVTVDSAVKYAGAASLKIEVPASGYTGGALVAAAPEDLSDYDAVTFWAKASAANALNVVGFGNNATTNALQVEWNGVALTTSWAKYIVPIPDASLLDAEDGLFHFAEGAEAAAYTIWLDDIQFETVGAVVSGATPAIATETVTREVGGTFAVNGSSVTYQVNGAGQTLAVSRSYFTWDSSDDAVATVDEAGLITAKAVGQADITAKLGSTAANGKVTFNVADANMPSAAAPAPTELAADVVSLFSNAYTNHAVDTWSAGWDSADVSDVQVAGGDVKKYSSLVYAGIEFTTATVDASAMTHFHIDIWSPDAATFKVKLVDFGANGVWHGDPNDDSEHELLYDVNSTPAVKTGEWVSFDIPLASFTNLASRGHLAQLIISSSNATVYVDNVYFYEGAAAPTEPTTAAPTPSLAAGNVVSLFSNAYTNHAVDTWSAGWDVADVADVQVAGNDAKKYTALVYAGIEFTTATVDASTMTHFHVDIWSPDAANFKVKLVDFGANGVWHGDPNDDSEHELTFDAGSTPAVVTGQWVSFDIPLASFTNLTAKGHLAQLIISSSTATVFVDNVYFHK